MVFIFVCESVHSPRLRFRNLIRMISRSITFPPLRGGGPGWTRTNDVSYVTGLQPTSFAAGILTQMYN